MGRCGGHGNAPKCFQKTLKPLQQSGLGPTNLNSTKTLRKLYGNSTKLRPFNGLCCSGHESGDVHSQRLCETFDTMKVPGHPWPAILAPKGTGSGPFVGAKWAPEGTVLYENSTKTLRIG